MFQEFFANVNVYLLIVIMKIPLRNAFLIKLLNLQENAIYLSMKFQVNAITELVVSEALQEIRNSITRYRADSERRILSLFR